jgi:hypothetical protein
MVTATTQKVEVSWDDALAGNFPENPARTAWREAVAEVARKAKAELPACNGRVESAVKIVLNGDVELLPDSKAKVASQSNGTTTYHVVNGSCDCKDFAKAPQSMCKHRIAYGIHKRAMPLAKQRLEAQLDGNGTGNGQHVAEAPKADVPATGLPEAPASCNVYVTLAGRKVQVTLRDSDEGWLLQRLEALLTRFPAEDEDEQEPQEGWCGKHSVQMTQHHNTKGSWWSHQLDTGKWCHGTGK